MTNERHKVPLEPDSRPRNGPGARTGIGVKSILPHLQQQVQTSLPVALEPDEPTLQSSDSPED